MKVFSLASQVERRNSVATGYTLLSADRPLTGTGQEERPDLFRLSAASQPTTTNTAESASEGLEAAAR